MMLSHVKPVAAAFSLAILGMLAAAPLAPRAQPAPQPAPRPANDAAKQQCFYARNISNFTANDNRVVYLRVGVRDIYRLDLMTACPELGFRQTIEVSRANGSSNICSGVDLTIGFRQSGARRVCPVREMRRLSPDEVAALPKRDRP